jgi:hypothetical protein
MQYIITLNHSLQGIYNRFLIGSPTFCQNLQGKHHRLNLPQPTCSAGIIVVGSESLSLPTRPFIFNIAGLDFSNLEF